jgi:hypothetical protein
MCAHLPSLPPTASLGTVSSIESGTARPTGRSSKDDPLVADHYALDAISLNVLQANNITNEQGAGRNLV